MAKSSGILKIGQLFAGRYQIVSQLGVGGMGEVYLAHDNILQKEKIALKLLGKDFAQDKRFIERFFRELALMRKISHENVVRSFDAGEFEGTSYYTMEYVEGRSLKEVVSDESISQIDRAVLMAQLFEGLSAIHDAGIIHRDIKPANILVTSEGVLKITDFGIARSQVSELTKPGELLGSVQFIAPEIWRGVSIGPGVDLYSAGIVWYQLATGVLPFDGDSNPELMRKHLQVTPLNPREFEPSIPQWISLLILSLLAKFPDGRPASAAAAAESIRENCALERHLVRAASIPRSTSIGPVESATQSDSPDDGELSESMPREERGLKWLGDVALAKLGGGGTGAKTHKTLDFGKHDTLYTRSIPHAVDVLGRVSLSVGLGTTLFALSLGVLTAAPLPYSAAASYFGGAIGVHVLLAVFTVLALCAPTIVILVAILEGSLLMWAIALSAGFHALVLLVLSGAELVDFLGLSMVTNLHVSSFSVVSAFGSALNRCVLAVIDPFSAASDSAQTRLMSSVLFATALLIPFSVTWFVQPLFRAIRVVLLLAIFASGVSLAVFCFLALPSIIGGIVPTLAESAIREFRTFEVVISGAQIVASFIAWAIVGAMARAIQIFAKKDAPILEAKRRASILRKFGAEE